MSAPSPYSSDESIRTASALWAVRRDRGLSAAESIEYELWLAADERHATAMQRSSAAWYLLDRMPESVAAPVLASASRRRSFWRRAVLVTSMAAAAAVAVGLFAIRRSATISAERAASTIVAATVPRTVTLSDGSLVHLNTGGELLEQFTPSERLVTLVRGEAHFSVTKNPARPFVVRARKLQVRAVGTAFNVNLLSATVDVIVTEGRVQLATGAATDAKADLGAAPGEPLLAAGQRAVLSDSGPDLTAQSLSRALAITEVDAKEVARVLAWRDPLLRLSGSTLSELAYEFEQRTGRRLILADPSLAEMRVGGRFRADDIDGFTHLLATTLDLDVERSTDGSLTLRKKNRNSR